MISVPAPMKSALKIGVLSSFLALALMANAEARSCSEIGEDLQAMQKAQASLLESMVRKNDSMATTLDQYAETFSVKKSLRKADLVGLKKSALAFRRHGDREEKLVQRFETKTAELISQVQECLKSKTIASE
jgi:hypothetical protein